MTNLSFTKTLRRMGFWVFGIAFVLFGAYLLVFLVPDVLITASGPQSLSLKRRWRVAGDSSHYATIEDGKSAGLPNPILSMR
ncbi:MAG: hypothetical protein R3E39_20755 [Anaerolineae bacterium]